MQTKYEKSCGAVVYTVNNGEIQYLLVQQLNGNYGFPKGHVEANETEIETATREIKEETNLNVIFIDGFRESNIYDLPKQTNTKKEVVYFLAYYEGQRYIYQKEELISIWLVNYERAMKMLTYPAQQNILKKANKFINKR